MMLYIRRLDFYLIPPGFSASARLQVFEIAKTTEGRVNMLKTRVYLEAPDFRIVLTSPPPFRYPSMNETEIDSAFSTPVNGWR